MAEEINIETASASEFYAEDTPYKSIRIATVELLTNPDALAIWVYLQTRKPTWKVIGSHLQKRFGIGRDRYRNAMKFLADAGLITREPMRDEDGRMAGTRIIVHYKPKGMLCDEPSVQDSSPSETPSVQVSDHSETPSLGESTPYVINGFITEQQDGEILGPSSDEPRELELTPPSGSPAKKKRKAIDYTQEFEEAWSAYPKREGSNNKRKAYSAWNARLMEGVAPEEMLAGVKRYAAYCDAKDTTGTQWVMQAQRFFGKDREFENDWSVAQQPSGKPSSATQSRASPHGRYDKIDYSRGIGPDGRF